MSFALSQIDEELPAFRATCYRSGAKHCFGSPAAGHKLGGLIQDAFGWKVNLKRFDIEVGEWVNTARNDDIRSYCFSRMASLCHLLVFRMIHALPHRDGTLWVGFLYLTLWSESIEGQT